MRCIWVLQCVHNYKSVYVQLQLYVYIYTQYIYMYIYICTVYERRRPSESDMYENIMVTCIHPKEDPPREIHHILPGSCQLKHC